MAHFTKYICFYELDKNNVLLLNALTSAIDILDKISFTKIQKMIDKQKLLNPESNFELYNSLKASGFD
ncbi:MAG: hypothetical protein LBR79_01480 [Oscillospiraceae bacterium]|jgi:hypothetical protein|nr:hypothetical protein [Oscillospiraceae bacterium]